MNVKIPQAAIVALLLPSAGDARKALERAMKLVAPEGKLWIVQTPGGQVPSAVSSWMIYLGFMGDRPSGDYQEVAMKEYRIRVRERLDDLYAIAKEHDVQCQTEILDGDTLKTVWRWVHKHHPDVVVIARPEIIDPERDLFAKIADNLEKRFTAKVVRV